MSDSVSRKIRILFLPAVDCDSTNAQSLNTREIALRLESSRFEATLFYQSEPDPRLRNQSHLRLQPLPKRMKTLALLREMMADYDLIAYMDYSPASYLFLHIPRALRREVKAILHVESTGIVLEQEAKLLSLLYNGVVPNCDAYTAITKCVARELEFFLKRTVNHILPIGVDTGVFAPSPLGHEGVVTVLFAGTLVPRKNPLDVVRAAKHFPAVRFRLIGPDRHGYTEVVRREIARSAADNVVLEGPKSQMDMALAMRQSHIFVLPSRVEGLPKVTLEAAASGLPCIVFRDYETPSVIDGVTGYQVQTLEEMIDRLGLLLRDRQLRETMGAAGRRHAEQFDWDLIAAQWQSAYLKIAGQA